VACDPQLGAERAQEIADGFVMSVFGSAGQLCTKPGFLFVQRRAVDGDVVTVQHDLSVLCYILALDR
jgi:acyl-CoA reductase-like NAD-dependent aldehyde dehydrogenase